MKSSEKIEQNDQEEPRASIWERTRKFATRHRAKLAIGATALSLGVTLATNTVGEVLHDAGAAAPWIGGGVVGGEVAFLAGAEMMRRGAGLDRKTILNVKEWKNHIPEFAKASNESRLYRAGFVINTSGAVLEAGLVIGGVFAYMPPSAYVGPLSIAVPDLAITYGVRRTMIRGIRDNLAEATPGIAEPIGPQPGFDVADVPTQPFGPAAIPVGQNGMPSFEYPVQLAE